MRNFKLPAAVACTVTILLISSLRHDARPNQVKPALPIAQLTLQAVRPFYIFDGPIPVCFEFQFPGEATDTYLKMTHWGLPPKTEVSLFNASGSRLVTKPLPLIDDGPGIHTIAPELAYDGVPIESAGGKINAPGGQVTLCPDLNRIFTIPSPGRYKLRINYRGKQVAETDINLLGLAIQDRKNITAGCNLTYNPKIFRGGDGAVLVVCEVVTGKVMNNGQEHWFATINEMKIGKDVINSPSFPFGVPKDTKIQSIRLDFQWKLWCVLEAGGQSSLIVWDLITEKATTVLPWSKDKIVIGSYYKGSDVSQKIVFAGISGKHSVNSLNLADR